MSKIKRPNICIYCQKTGNLTKEHIVANWVKNVVPRTGTKHTLTSTLFENRIPGKVAIIPGFSERNGDVGTRTIRRVCGNCNSSQLNVHQEQAKPLLTNLMNGGRESILPEAAKLLASWICMTVTNIDSADKNGGGVTAAERTFFYENGSPPPNWNIFIGRTSTHLPLTYCHRPGSLQARHIPLASKVTRNMQITTLTCGRLLIHAFSFPINAMKMDNFEYADKFRLYPIFPVSGERRFNWAGAPELDERDIDAITNKLFWNIIENFSPRNKRTTM